MTVLGRTAVANTELVAAYMTIDPRVRELCLFVKHWARQRRCAAPAIVLRARATIDASPVARAPADLVPVPRRSLCVVTDGYISPYAWTLLCIFYLQTSPFFCLPSLQAEAAAQEVAERPWMPRPQTRRNDGAAFDCHFAAPTPEGWKRHTGHGASAHFPRHALWKLWSQAVVKIGPRDRNGSKHTTHVLASVSRRGAAPTQSTRSTNARRTTSGSKLLNGRPWSAP